MIVLSLSGIKKSFITEKILDNISFMVDSKDKIGLIGSNGSGKTTLMNIISGNLNPDDGEIHRTKDLKMGYLQQNIEFKENKTVYEICIDKFRYLIEMENQIRDMELKMGKTESEEELENLMKNYADLTEEFTKNNGYGYQSEIKGALKGLGFSEEDFDKDVFTLSGGQKSRLHLASLLLQNPDILLLDEPTNHLDLDATRFLENFLINFSGAVILISHDRYFLDRVTNKIFHIENRKLNIYNSNYSKFVETRKKNLEVLKKSYIQQQKEIKRQEEIIERFSNYGRDRYIKQAESRRKQLGKIERIEKPFEDIDKFKLEFTPKIATGNEVVRFEEVAKIYDDKTILQNISFEVFKNDRIGIIGENGIGKSTLIKMIMNKVKPDDGEVILGSNVIKGYYDQEQDSLGSGLIIDEIMDSNPELTIGQARNYLAAFNFYGEDVFKSIDELSGGEKGRISLLKIMLKKPNFLIMDEPTNHLDIDSKEILENALNSFDATFLVISHDRYFLNKVANKIILIERDKATVYYGNYDYYREKLEESQIEDEISDGRTKTSILKEKKKIAQSSRIKSERNKKIKAIERELENLDKIIEDLKIESYKPEVYNDYKKALEISNDIEKNKEKRDNLFNDWFELSEMAEDEND